MGDFLLSLINECSLKSICDDIVDKGLCVQYVVYRFHDDFIGQGRED